MEGAIAVCALTAFASFLSAGGRTEKTVRAALAVLLAAALLRGASDVTVTLRGAEGILWENGEYPIVTGTQTALESGIRAALADAFSLSEEEVEVRVFDLDTASMRPASVSVLLTGRAAFADAAAIRRFVAENGWGECEIRVEIG